MKDQEGAIRELRELILGGADDAAISDALWECIRAFQGETFRTSGRGGRGGVEFSYRLKVSKITGQETGELLVSRKEQSKTVTRSTVWLGFTNALEVQREEGVVKGPKKLKVFGASYLYPLFLRFGIITATAEEKFSG